MCQHNAIDDVNSNDCHDESDDGGNRIIFHLLGFGNATRLAFHLNGTNVTGSTDVVLDQWHHVAVTYNSSSIKTEKRE